MESGKARAARAVMIVAALAALTACGSRQEAKSVSLSSKSVDCMARAMYFESIRSSRDGMVAVGTVVMNRVRSDDFPSTVCGVVGQKNQFAPGVMTKPMTGEHALIAQQTAAAVLAGERHPMVDRARFFHAASYRAGYDNMHYVLTAGGNAFYEKRPSDLVTRSSPLPPLEGLTGR